MKRRTRIVIVAASAVLFLLVASVDLLLKYTAAAFYLGYCDYCNDPAVIERWTHPYNDRFELYAVLLFVGSIASLIWISRPVKSAGASSPPA